MVDVVVCVCTCRRPAGLAKLLDALEALDWREALRVVVVDNDSAMSARPLCDRVSVSYRWPLEYVHEPKRGISHARNRAVATALAHRPAFIAMLDDDEWPSSRWLGELMRVQRTYDADLVGGPVMPVFAGRKAAWIDDAADCYGYDQPLPDGAACQLHGSGNFVGRAACFEALGGEVFRIEFARSGGEDFDFFRRLAAKGYTMHWAARAIAYESVPESRMTIDWVRQRMQIKGNIQVRLFRLHAPGPLAEGVRIVKTSMLMAAGGLHCLVGVVYRPSRMRGRLLLWRALGKIEAHLGRTLMRPEQTEGR